MKIAFANVCILFVAFYANMGNAACEIVPGVGIEGTCYVGMDIERLRSRIYAVDERFIVWYLDRGEVNVVHDGKKVEEVFFAFRLGEMLDNLFNQTAIFAGSIQGITNNVCEMSACDIGMYWKLPPVVSLETHRLTQRFQLPAFACICERGDNRPCRLDFRDKGILFQFSLFDGKVDDVNVFKPASPATNSVSHGVIAVGGSDEGIVVGFGNIDCKDNVYVAGLIGKTNGSLNNITSGSLSVEFKLDVDGISANNVSRRAKS